MTDLETTPLLIVTTKARLVLQLSGVTANNSLLLYPLSPCGGNHILIWSSVMIKLPQIVNDGKCDRCNFNFGIKVFLIYYKPILVYHEWIKHKSFIN